MDPPYCMSAEHRARVLTKSATRSNLKIQEMHQRPLYRFKFIQSQHPKLGITKRASGIGWIC